MRKLLLLLLLMGTTTLFAQQGFKIKGNIKGLGDCKMIFSNITINNDWLMDTIDVKNGKFEIAGRVEHPTLYSLMVSNSPKAKGGFFSAAVFVENSNISITGDLSKSNKILVKGSKSDDEYNEIMNILEPASKKRKSAQYASSEAFKKGDEETQDKMREVQKEALKEMKTLLLARPNYATSLVIPYVVERNFSASSTFDLMPELLQGFDKSIHNNPYVSYLLADYERETKVKVGLKAHNFSLKDLDGNEYRLSDYKGKYVLLEFSASWCGWCKLEVPFLKEVYEITKDKDNFVMFTVNLDTTRELWKKEVDESNVGWKMIGDLQGTKGGVAHQYNIHGVPAIFLISPEGEIISKSLRRENMVEFFKKMYAK